MRTTIMTPSTPTRMTRTITTRATCMSEHSSTPLVVFSVSLIMCHTHLIGSSCSLSLHSIPSSLMSVSPWPRLPPFLLRPVLPRLLPLLCPDVPWPADRPLWPRLRAKWPAPLRQGGASTPTTSPTPSQVMSPTTRSSTTRSPMSSSTPSVPSPTLLRHRTRT